MHFIGIDIGTSSISSIVFDPATRKVKSFTLPNQTSIQTPDPWTKLQDPCLILEQVEYILEGFFARYADIRGIGITGQMHGMLYTDGKGDAVSPLYTWQDGRGNHIYREEKTYAAYLSEQTGYELATGYGLVTHYYNQVNQQVPATAEKLCTIMDFVTMKLAGQTYPVTDFSNGASLGFFDVEKLAFDHDALAQAGIDTAILPRLASARNSLGDFRGAAVYPAIGDNQAAFLGSVDQIQTAVHVTVGTSSQLSVYSEKYIKVPNLDTRPFPGGGYLLVGAALCGGQAFALLKDFFRQTVDLLTDQELSETEIYRRLIAIPYETKQAPEVETLFDGARYAPWKRGVISGISMANFTPQQLTIGFLKGIAQELYQFYQAIPAPIKAGKTTLVGSGNGLKKNPLLREAFKETFSYSLRLSDHQEEAALGACIRMI
ncbi:MAG: hypothetical protein LBU37_14040 [Tannerellaceae bacterium]|jgi:sedoheptulokinase|nr:hypothetical protein [Tannerellaceae bacterium]